MIQLVDRCPFAYLIEMLLIFLENRIRFKFLVVPETYIPIKSLMCLI